MTEYEKHLQALIGAKLAGHPRNRAERKRQQGTLRDAARYCERALRRNPDSKVHERMAEALKAVGR